MEVLFWPVMQVHCADHFMRDYGSRGSKEKAHRRKDSWILLLRENMGCHLSWAMLTLFLLLCWWKFPCWYQKEWMKLLMGWSNRFYVVWSDCPQACPFAEIHFHSSGSFCMLWMCWRNWPTSKDHKLYEFSMKEGIGWITVVCRLMLDIICTALGKCTPAGGIFLHYGCDPALWNCQNYVVENHLAMDEKNCEVCLEQGSSPTCWAISKLTTGSTKIANCMFCIEQWQNAYTMKQFEQGLLLHGRNPLSVLQG